MVTAFDPHAEPRPSHWEAEGYVGHAHLLQSQFHLVDFTWAPRQCKELAHEIATCAVHENFNGYASVQVLSNRFHNI